MSSNVTTCQGTLSWDKTRRGYRLTFTAWVGLSRWTAIGCQTFMWPSVLLLLWITMSYAQVTTTITPDGTLGTEVTPNGNVHEITGGTRPSGGPNLFHSFDRFNVETGDTAHFIGAPGIDHIIGRVTGPDASMIDGTLQSDASLFLLNPQGMMFGPNATLDINGSFHASTADVLRFADGAELSTRLSAKSTVTVAPPAAFGFLSNNPAGIQVQGSDLALENGTLSIIGGDIRIEGAASISAPGGQINLVSVASRGETVFDPSISQTDVAIKGFDQLGEIEIVEESKIDVSSANEGAGTVVVRGEHLTINNASIVAESQGETHGNQMAIDVQVAKNVTLERAAQISTKTLGGGDAGNIAVSAQHVHILFVSRIAAESGPTATGRLGSVTITATDDVILKDLSAILSEPTGEDRGGYITVSASNISVESTSQISFNTGALPFIPPPPPLPPPPPSPSSLTSSSFSAREPVSNNSIQPDSGALSAVTVKATDTLLLEGQQSSIFTRTRGGENSGQINVSAKRVIIRGGRIDSGIPLGPGRGSTTTVTATDSILLDGGMIFAGAGSDRSFGDFAGDAGEIIVSAPRVRLTGGARIDSTTFGSGNAGRVIVLATNSITLDGAETGIFSGTSVISSDGSPFESSGGAGAPISISAPRIHLIGGARIDSSSSSKGAAGTITVRAMQDILISGRDPDGVLSGISSQTEGEGEAGRISLFASQVTITGGRVTTRTRGAESGGDIIVEGETVRFTEGAELTADSTGTGNAGNIRIGGAITANNDIVESLDRLSLEGSRISADTDAGDGANITIGARQVILDRGSEITANTNTGVGGNVAITGSVAADGQTLSRAGTVVLRGSKITANAQDGQGGRINILTEAFLADPASLLAASSQEGGIDGEVNVEAVVSNLSEVVRPLSQPLAPDTTLLRDRCAARLHQGLISSFVERERAGLASSPEGLQPARRDTHAPEVVSSGGSLPHGIAMANEPSWRLQSRCP